MRQRRYSRWVDKQAFVDKFLYQIVIGPCLGNGKRCFDGSVMLWCQADFQGHLK